MRIFGKKTLRVRVDHSRRTGTSKILSGFVKSTGDNDLLKKTDTGDMSIEANFEVLTRTFTTK